MKRIILFIMISCYILAGKAFESTSDSLLRIYRNSPHSAARLENLSNVIKIEQNNAQCISLSDALMKEALAQGNDHYAGLAAYYHLAYYYNHNKPDSVTKWLKIMEPLARKSGLWNNLFDAKSFQIDLYIYKGQYELAICKANQMKKEALKMKNNSGVVSAYQCLGNAYIASKRWDEGIEAIEKAFHLLTEDDNPVIRISILTQFITIAKERKDYNNLLQYLQILSKDLSTFIKKNPSLKQGFNDIFMFHEVFYTDYYLHANRRQEAYKHLKKSRKYFNTNIHPLYKVLYYDIHASYYQHIHNYEEALKYIDTTLIILKNDLQANYAEQLIKKANILTEAGNNPKALLLYQKALDIKDSVIRTVSQNQMDLIKSNYHLDKIELEQRKQNNQIALIWLGVILIILFALFIVMYHASKVRHTLKQSEAEIRKATRMVHNANEMKNRFLTNMSYNIRTPLNNVVGFSQIIASEPDIDEETRQEYSQIVHQSSEYLMKLVNDVLDLSRLEAHMMKFQIQTYDAVALCNEACYMARMRNEKTGIQIEFSTEIELQEIITDTGRLTQLLLSALTYPKEYQEKRVVQLTLSKTENTLYFYIQNTPLADSKLVSQEVHIRNDINRLLIEHFGGIYQVNPQTPEGPEIVFTYPITPMSE